MNNWYIIIIILVILIAGGAAAALLLSGNNNNNNNNNNNFTGSTTIGKFKNSYYGSAKDYESAINQASNRWSNYITEDVTIPINYHTFNNPTSSTLASASMNDSNNIRAGGTININIGRNAPVAGWDDVIEHEICHVLGLPQATKWQNAIVQSGGNYFLDAADFPETANAYNTILGGSGNIPLQSGGAHWDESIFGIELMTPNIGIENELKTTLLTLTAMKELGWSIDLSQAEPL